MTGHTAIKADKLSALKKDEPDISRSPDSKKKLCILMSRDFCKFQFSDQLLCDLKDVKKPDGKSPKIKDSCMKTEIEKDTAGRLIIDLNLTDNL